MKSILAYIVFVVLVFISCNSTNKKEKSVSILNEPNSSAQPKTKIEEKQNSINSTPLEKSNPKPSKPFKFKSSKSIFITDKYYKDTIATIEIPNFYYLEKNTSITNDLSGLHYHANLTGFVDATLKFSIIRDYNSLDELFNNIRTGIDFNQASNSFKKLETINNYQAYRLERKWKLKRDLSTFKKGEIYVRKYLIEIKDMFLVIDYSCHQNVKAQIEATNNLLLETLKAY